MALIIPSEMNLVCGEARWLSDFATMLHRLALNMPIRLLARLRWALSGSRLLYSSILSSSVKFCGLASFCFTRSVTAWFVIGVCRCSKNCLTAVLAFDCDCGDR